MVLLNIKIMNSFIEHPKNLLIAAIGIIIKYKNKKDE